jgi:hypothetical protein
MTSGRFLPLMLKTANMNAMVAYEAVPRRAPEERHVNFAEGCLLYIVSISNVATG